MGDLRHRALPAARSDARLGGPVTVACRGRRRVPSTTNQLASRCSGPRFLPLARPMERKRRGLAASHDSLATASCPIGGEWRSLGICACTATRTMAKRARTQRQRATSGPPVGHPTWATWWWPGPAGAAAAGDVRCGCPSATGSASRRACPARPAYVGDSEQPVPTVASRGACVPRPHAR